MDEHKKAGLAIWSMGATDELVAYIESLEARIVLLEALLPPDDDHA